MTHSSTEVVDPNASAALRMHRVSVGDGLAPGFTDALRLRIFGEPLAFGRYRCVRWIGAGGFGAVYEAWDPALDRAVAVKVLRPQVEGSPLEQVRRRMLREAKALAAIRHPNVVEIFDVGWQHGCLYIVMELVQGITLAQWLGAARHREREILDVFMHAARGLSAAHQAGIVHRDFKPSNVLIANNGQVKVGDFGLAKLTADADGSDATQAQELGSGSSATTERGLILGTPLYMAPEQHRGEPVDARADVFAFCLCLCEALLGHYPLAREPASRRADEKRSAAERLPAMLPLGTRARDAVSRGLHADPRERADDPMWVMRLIDRDRSSRGTRALVVGIAVLAASIVGAAWSSDAAAPCLADAIRAEAQWAGRRDELSRALATTVLADSSARLTEDLEAHASSLARSWREACTTPDAEARAERIACLQSTREDFEILSAELTTSAADVVASIDAVAQLPRPDRCLAPTEHPRFSQATPETARALRRAWALYSLQSPAALRPAVEELAAELDPADERTAARLDYLRAWLASLDDGKETAGLLYERAYWAATSAGDEELAHEAAVRAAFVELDHFGRTDRARTWARHAAAVTGDASSPRRLAHQTELTIRLSAAEKDYDAGVQAGLQTIDTLQAAGLGESRLALGVRLGLVRLLLDAGRLDEVEELALRNLDHAIALYGAGAVPVAGAREMLARYYGAIGNPDRARQQLEAALDIYERSASSPALAVAVLSELGRVEMLRDRPEAALGHYQRAIETSERGGEDFRLGLLLVNVGLAEIVAGALDDAAFHLERADVILSGIAGSEHVARPYISEGFASIAFERGSFVDAARIATEAATTFTSSADSSLSVESWIIAAAAHVELGDAARASAALAAAEAEHPLPNSQASCSMIRARLSLLQGDAETAVRHAEAGVAMLSALEYGSLLGPTMLVTLAEAQLAAGEPPDVAAAVLRRAHEGAATARTGGRRTFDRRAQAVGDLISAAVRSRSP